MPKPVSQCSPVVRPAGEAVKDGVRMQRNYHADAELLEAKCVSAPFWIDAARISSKLNQEIEAALKSGQAACFLGPPYWPGTLVFLAATFPRLVPLGTGSTRTIRLALTNEHG